MSRKAVTLEIDSDLFKVLERRAKQNFMTLRELIEDIIRRSMLSYRGGAKTEDKVDDALIGIFSRKKRKQKR